MQYARRTGGLLLWRKTQTAALEGRPVREKEKKIIKEKKIKEQKKREEKKKMNEEKK